MVSGTDAAEEMASGTDAAEEMVSGTDAADEMQSESGSQFVPSYLRHPFSPSYQSVTANSDNEAHARSVHSPAPSQKSGKCRCRGGTVLVFERRCQLMWGTLLIYIS